MSNWEDDIGKPNAPNVVTKELEMHQLIEGEESLKEKTLTQSEASRIMRSGRGHEFKEVISEMKRQGRIVADPPPPTYDELVKASGIGKHVWRQSEIQQLTPEEWGELSQMGEFGMNGSARKEGRIFMDIDGSSLLSYQIGRGENSIPLDSKGVANYQVRDTEKNRAIWQKQRDAYNVAKKRNDSALELIRKNYNSTRTFRKDSDGTLREVIAPTKDEVIGVFHHTDGVE